MLTFLHPDPAVMFPLRLLLIIIKNIDDLSSFYYSDGVRGPDRSLVAGRGPEPPLRNFDWGGGGGRRFPRGDWLSQTQVIFILSRKIRIFTL